MRFNRDVLHGQRASTQHGNQTGYLGIILCMRPANERRRYNVTSSLISWVHTQNDIRIPTKLSAPACQHVHEHLPWLIKLVYDDEKKGKKERGKCADGSPNYVLSFPSLLFFHMAWTGRRAKHNGGHCNISRKPITDWGHLQIGRKWIVGLQ